MALVYGDFGLTSKLSMNQIEDLKRRLLPDLKEIARVLEIQRYQYMRKDELIDAIMAIKKESEAEAKITSGSPKEETGAAIHSDSGTEAGEAPKRKRLRLASELPANPDLFDQNSQQAREIEKNPLPTEAPEVRADSNSERFSTGICLGIPLILSLQKTDHPGNLHPGNLCQPKGTMCTRLKPL